MIYFDHAATSFPKPTCVQEAMMRCIQDYCANPGRGSHDLALQAAKAVSEVREVVAKFFNISNPSRLVFTKNATEGLNMAIKGYVNPGDHVITTSMEHNSVIRPLMGLEKNGLLQLTVLPCDETGTLSPNQLEAAIKSRTTFLVATLASNVNGRIMPVSQMADICAAKGIAFLLDASQGAGTVAIDVQKLKVDMMAFPGHKGLLGPQGTGGLYIREGLRIRPWLEGGTGSSSENIFQPETMPELLEGGTLNTPGIVGLGAGIAYLQQIGLQTLRQHKNTLVQRFLDGILPLNGIQVYSPREAELNSGIVAFNVASVEATELAYVLDKVYGIALRAGLHCASLAHKTLGTLPTGCIRLSVGYSNTTEEIDESILALTEITNHLEGDNAAE